ncbi:MULTISPECIES: hypothetical protein [unclassified Tepidimonas]|uniref:hypothetical protein n=1 Tax=unclassified Tepidimonas TaxID=2631705 RepID=UPI003C7DE2E8
MTRISARRWLAALLLAPWLALAAPGAHGPNGEHLDGPGGHAHGPATDAPRVEAHSDLFELVATLADGELSLLIDRYATNEPVLNAKVEVEAGKAKAVAKFHADHGDYAVADEAFLKAISQPGEHPLVITITAANDNDLLDGVLKVTPAEHKDHAAATWQSWAWAVGVLVAAVLLGLVWWSRRRGSSLSRSAA